MTDWPVCDLRGVPAMSLPRNNIDVKLGVE
jgi:hypothetical protein